LLIARVASCRLVEQFALLGQQQSAGMAMEQGGLELLLEAANLAADRGLAQIQLLAGVGQAAGVCNGMENP